MGMQIRDERQRKALTGLSQAQFDHLLSVFSDIYQTTQQQTYAKGVESGTRMRTPGGGAKGKLPTMADKLLFVLYYYKTYPDVVFALFDLLGMQFSPRIRDLGHQRLYKLKNDRTIYKRLDARLTGRVYPTRLIDRWDNLARVAGYLKHRYVTASLLISKLQAYPRQNHLTKLLQEYERLIKTIFILRYLEDQSLRQRVHAQLNKGEALHQLRKFLFFVRDGAVLQKDEEDQNNQAACLNILTNAVIVWNTVYMQAALEALREEGHAVKDEDLVHLSPARFAHIHRYGKYHFDVETARSRRRLRPLRR